MSPARVLLALTTVLLTLTVPAAAQSEPACGEDVDPDEPVLIAVGGDPQLGTCREIWRLPCQEAIAHELARARSPQEFDALVLNGDIVEGDTGLKVRRCLDPNPLVKLATQIISSPWNHARTTSHGTGSRTTM